MQHILRHCALLFVFLFLHAGVNAQSILYVGNTRVDLDFGHNNEPGVVKVEIYRDKPVQTKIGEMVNGGSGLVFYSDKGLVRGTRYYYSLKKYKSDNTTQVVGLAFVQTGEVRGFLWEDETWDDDVVIMDSVVVLLGTLHIKDGAKIVPGTRQIWTKINVNSAGRVMASGGSLTGVLIDCFGQFSPIKNMSLSGTNILLHGAFTTLLDGAVLEEDNPTDKVPVYLYSPHNLIEARNSIVRGASEIVGAALVESCIVEPYSRISGTVVRHCWIKADGFVALRPNEEQTLCEHNRFDSSQVGVSQQSIVQFNRFTGYGSVLISATSAGFPKKDVENIHINYNGFLKLQGEVAYLSNTDADTVDATKNYWGNYCGPDPPQRFTKAFYDPYLRVPYPQPSYWLDIKPDKLNIIANGQDQVKFSGRMYEVLSGNITPDSTVKFFVTCGGDTVANGTVQTGPDGRVSFSFTLPFQYSNFTNCFARIQSIQGIGQCAGELFIINIGAASGPDLTIDSVQVLQVQAAAPAIIAEKRFAVKVDIGTSDAVQNFFQVAIKVNGQFYTRFYKFVRPNIDLDFTLRAANDSLNLPNGEYLSLYFFPDISDLPPGQYEVEATIDPPDASHPVGKVIEANDFNNVRSIQFTVQKSHWGNEKDSSNLKVLFQPFEMDMANLPRFNVWCDSATNFMRKVFPMNASQLEVTRATDVHAPSPRISDKTLLDSTFEDYLTKAYKLLRTQKPSFDRYILAVPDDWFFRRIDPWYFDNKLSTSMGFSGIPDLVVARVHHFKAPVHELGHTFGLRRSDHGQPEEYHLYNIGKQVIEGVDAETRGLKEYGLPSYGTTTQEVLCFMSNGLINFGREYWVCDEDYLALITSMRQYVSGNREYSKFAAGETMLVTGVADSLGGISFGAWEKLQAATLSPQSDSASSPYVFRVLDSGGNPLARYFYRPTFTARGLDEGFTRNPRLLQEHFAFVLPWPSGAKTLSVLHNGSEILTRSETANPPAVQFTSPPQDRDTTFSTDFTIRWQGSDPDGGTLFYTVYWSSDGGFNWMMHAMDITADSLGYSILDVARGTGYKIKVVVSDGILTSSAVSRSFNVDNEVGVDPLSPPASFRLEQNFPNPFHASTTITYDLFAQGRVLLEVVDMLGRPVMTLLDAEVEPGRYVHRLSADRLAPGMYLVRLRMAGTSSVKRIVVVR